MNFFAAQNQALKRTKWLILWFTGGVIGTVACLYAVVVAGLELWKRDQAWQGEWWNQPMACWTAGAGALLVIGGTIFKLSQLSQGGSVIALDLGARQVDLHSQVPAERQLLNVVEEMAIASGIPMPQVWVMDDETSINAFAAGTEPANAVIGVSRGCLQKLTRDELQGVIAHEFSHILHGDMRLNVHLIGWVFGLLMIAMLGRWLISSIRFTRSSSSRSDKSNAGLIVALLVTGVSLWLIGSLGVLFGRIIQSAVSRQREFLADASAVQFTRNPQGIAGALKKIMRGGNRRLSTAAASEAAHLLFTSGGSGFFQQWLATHPPLEERIQAIDRDALIGNPVSSATQVASPEGAVSAFAGASPTSASFDLAHAQELRTAMARRGEIQSLDDAKGCMLALVVSADADQWPQISQSPAVVNEIKKWQSIFQGVSTKEKIARMELTFPWLREMQLLEYRSFCADMQSMIEADGQVSLFEWMLYHAIHRHLEGYFGYRKPKPILWHELAHVEEPLAELLACFRQLAPSQNASQQVLQEYHRLTQRELPSREPNFAEVDAALRLLEQASPLVKSQAFSLCRLAVNADGVIHEEEWQMLRATADALGLIWLE
jgi:Zn-dependent protease with chaperone function